VSYSCGRGVLVLSSTPGRDVMALPLSAGDSGSLGVIPVEEEFLILSSTPDRDVMTLPFSAGEAGGPFFQVSSSPHRSIF